MAQHLRGKGMPEGSFDLIIVGGGPGGYVAAIRARQLGLATALVERDELGGVCLNWGCIPTKALLRASELMHLMTEAKQFGFDVGSVSFDLGKVVQRSRRVAKRLSAGVRHLMKKNGVEVVPGHARLAGPGVLQACGARTPPVVGGGTGPRLPRPLASLRLASR